MFVTGPNVVKTVTHEEVSSEDLGGASAHSTKSGVCHFTSDNDAECLMQLRRLYAYLPLNCEEKAPRSAGTDPDKSKAGRTWISSYRIIPTSPTTSRM